MHSFSGSPTPFESSLTSRVKGSCRCLASNGGYYQQCEQHFVICCHRSWQDIKDVSQAIMSKLGPNYSLLSVTQHQDAFGRLNIQPERDLLNFSNSFLIPPKNVIIKIRMKNIIILEMSLLSLWEHLCQNIIWEEIHWVSGDKWIYGHKIAWKFYWKRKVQKYLGYFSISL